jgi:hypothetical protein
MGDAACLSQYNLELGANYGIKDGNGRTMGVYGEKGAQSRLPAAAAAAGRQGLDDLVLACSVIEASPEWRAKERAWAYHLYPGLEELEERVDQAHQEARRQLKQLREFNSKWGDIRRWVRTRHFGSTLFLRRRLALLDADSAGSHVLVRSEHAGVLAVRADPDWGAYCGMMRDYEAQQQQWRDYKRDNQPMLQAARALPQPLPPSVMAAAAAPAMAPLPVAAGAAAPPALLAMRHITGQQPVGPFLCSSSRKRKATDEGLSAAAAAPSPAYVAQGVRLDLVQQIFAAGCQHGAGPQLPAASEPLQHTLPAVATSSASAKAASCGCQLRQARQGAGH